MLRSKGGCADDIRRFGAANGAGFRGGSGGILPSFGFSGDLLAAFVPLALSRIKNGL